MGGVRLPGPPFLRLPTPPPEFHIESWRESIAKLKAEKFSRIAPTHFGVFEDAGWHLNALEQTLHDVEKWMEATLPNIIERDAIAADYVHGTHKLVSPEAGSQDDNIKLVQATIGRSHARRARAAAWALLMGASRVYLRAHWMTDVAAGVALGAAIAIGVALLRIGGTPTLLEAIPQSIAIGVALTLREGSHGDQR